MARFIEISTSELETFFNGIANCCEANGDTSYWETQGSEMVFGLVLMSRQNLGAFVPEIKIYTTIAKGASTVRGCGKDAIRIVVGASLESGFKPCAKSQKLLRTAPAGSRDDRVAAFFDRFKKALRAAYKAAATIEACPRCGRPMAQRKSKANGGSLFLGCTGYPACKTTKSL